MRPHAPVRRLPFAAVALALLALAGLALWLISPRSGSASAATGVRCVPSHLNVSSSLAGGLVTVSPEPESRDAAAKTQISFLGVAASQLSSISVHGARSGAHGGHLRAYSQGDGASFVLSHALDYGEQVTVHASVANGASTVPFSWSFTTASRDDGGVAGGTPQPRPQSSDYQHFLTRTDLRPPLVAVTAHSPAASSEDLFVAPYSGPGQYGPMILDSSGRLVWFKALPHNTRAADFQVQEYEGKPVLTWWQNPLITGSEKRAGIVIANSAYETIATIRAGNGYQADLHEFLIRPNGTALLTVYNAIDCDLSSVGARSDAAIADTLFEELDLKTGLVRYEWHSLDHVPLSNAYTSARYASERTPYDYFHINSVELQSSGDYLVDSRDTWAAYDVSARTGQVQWELGGKHSSFKEPADAKTAYQHDARRQPDGTITFFDNGATPTVHDQSRAVALRLDEQARTATVVRDFRHPKPLVSGSQGNVQPLANGNWVVGWGEDPWFSEFSPTGELLFDAHLPATYESYRTFRLAWKGEPHTTPAVTAASSGSGSKRRTVVYVSWNGATEVAGWQLLAGSSSKTLSAVTSVGRNGFETKIALPAAAAGAPAAAYVQVQALNAAGAVIGSSRVTKL